MDARPRINALQIASLCQLQFAPKCCAEKTEMNIVYLSREGWCVTPALKLDGDILELLANNWDDFGSKNHVRQPAASLSVGLLAGAVQDLATASDLPSMTTG
jgi:hypothetical protein